VYNETTDWKPIMPTYDYVCDGCDHRFEEMQSFSAQPLKTCPSCGTEKLRRLFGTGAAILFKGGGFYETDYRSDAYKSAAKSESEAPKPTTTEKPASGGSGASPGTTAKTDSPGK
jgi:putative FmdB family regulatory protein